MSKEIQWQSLEPWDSGAARLERAPVQGFEKGHPLFATQSSSEPPTAMGPRALHALHTTSLRHCREISPTNRNYRVKSIFREASTQLT